MGNDQLSVTMEAAPVDQLDNKQFKSSGSVVELPKLSSMIQAPPMLTKNESDNYYITLSVSIWRGV